MSDGPPRESDNDVVSVLELGRCTDCLSCTQACPFADGMDVVPASLVRRAVESGIDELIRARAIWLCTDCRACSRACPVRIDVGALVEALRREAFARGKAADEPIRKLHALRAAEVREAGRVREARVFSRTRRWGFPRGSLALALALKSKLGRLFGRLGPVRE